jgi:zinc protease
VGLAQGRRRSGLFAGHGPAFAPQFSAEKLQLAQQQEATGIVRRNDDEGEIAGRESAKLVYGANSPYTRQPELATIGAVTWTI